MEKDFMIHIDLNQYKLDWFLSNETFEYHYWKHHKGYNDNLLNLIKNTEYEKMLLVDIVKKSQWIIFNNSAQIWNHNFYFEALMQNKQNINWKILDLININYWDFNHFKELFTKSALSNFWSWWTWLAYFNWKLEIINTSNAQTLLTMNWYIPLLVLDVWEHAYYIDYRNNRWEYINVFFDYLNWNLINERLLK